MSLKVQALFASRFIMEFVADDDIWRTFGFKAHAKGRGRLVRMMNPEWLQLETLLVNELWAVGISAIFVWAQSQPKFAHRIEFVARVFEIMIDGLRSEHPLWGTYRFSDRDHALAWSAHACRDYSAAGGSDYAAVFVERCRDRWKGEIPAHWLVGASMLFVTSSPIVAVQWASRDAGIAEMTESDLEVADSRYIDVVARLFDNQVPYFR